jgi:RNA polymerase sigma factor (sigma-70 family)
MTRASPSPADAERLLEHARWMRGLARSLVGDGARAEDLAQETWTRLLESPPRLDQPFRGWIATVMRNLVRAEGRGSARRAARELASARPEAEPSSHELVERAALQRELVQAVLELEEPYRTAILLRYFEERTPPEIAARERLPLATVKTRLARGLARLRERLARTHAPDGRASVLALLAELDGPRGAPGQASPPCSPTGASPAPWTLASLAMNAKLLAPLVLLAAAGLAYLWFGHDDDGAPRAVALPAPELAVPSHAAVSAPGAPGEPAEREAVLATTAAARPAPEGPAASPSAPVRGRVIDLQGAPIAGVEVALTPLESPGRPLSPAETASAEVVALSGPEGAFEFPGPRRGSLFLRDARWTTLLAGVPVDGRSGQECRIVAAPSLALAGVVVDDLGTPLAGARVRLAPPADLRARLAQVLDFSASVACTTLSDEQGRFRFASAPALPDGALEAELAGLLPCREPAPLAARADLVLVLSGPAPDGATLAGLVVDAGGAPVEGALVSHGLDTTRSDEHGRFRFALDDPGSLNRRAAEFLRVPDDLLRAVAPGFQPAELRARERTPEGAPLWPEPLVLRLGGALVGLEGTVVDERGDPLAGYRVWIADPALFGTELRGAATESFPELVQVEALLGGRGAGWNWVESDADGRFALAGLCEREYTLAAMDPATLQRCVTGGLAAGRRDVVLVVRTGESFARLAGRVLDGRGRPVPGAAVFPMCDALEIRLEGATIATQHESAPGTASDAEGRFVLERVPKELVYLRIDGAGVIPLEWGRGEPGGLAALVDEPEELVLTVERRCHFQVELSVPAEADALGVLDAEGHALVVSEFVGNGRNDTERHPLVDGRSTTLAVGDRAATLVLYRAGSEVRRVGLELTPGAPLQLRL